MSSIPVFADVLSRLQADIAIVRLVHAGIRPDRVSAIFPRFRAPNSVCCWLSDFHRVPLASALPVAAAGVFGRLWRRGTRSQAVEKKLEALGLRPEVADRCLEKIEAGRIVLCVHAGNEMEAAIAGRTFQRVGAENISCAIEHQPWDGENAATGSKWAPLAA